MDLSHLRQGLKGLCEMAGINRQLLYLKNKLKQPEARENSSASLSSLKVWGIVGFQQQTQVTWAPLLSTTRRKGKEYGAEKKPVYFYPL